MKYFLGSKSVSLIDYSGINAENTYQYTSKLIRGKYIPNMGGGRCYFSLKYARYILKLNRFGYYKLPQILERQKIKIHNVIN